MPTIPELEDSLAVHYTMASVRLVGLDACNAHVPVSAPGGCDCPLHVDKDGLNAEAAFFLYLSVSKRIGAGVHSSEPEGLLKTDIQCSTGTYGAT